MDVLLYRVYAYPVGPPTAQSVAASANQHLPTDHPAVLIVCEDAAARDQLLLELRDRYRGASDGDSEHRVEQPAQPRTQ